MDHDAVLARFWERMEGIYPQRWRSSVGANALSVAGREWALALSTLTLEQIRDGLDACNSGAIAEGSGRELDWPPSSGRFRAAALGIPSLAAIRREFASKDAQRSPFGMLVAERMDLWQFRQADARGAAELLRDAYAEARTFRLEGGALPQVFPALPDDTDREPKPATPETAAAVLAAMREMLDGEPPVRWIEDRGLWVAALPISGGREARVTVVPPMVEGEAWRWRAMVAGDVVHADMEPDAETAKEAAIRWAAGHSP